MKYENEMKIMIINEIMVMKWKKIMKEIMWKWNNGVMK